MCSRYRLVKEKIVITINGREIEVTLQKRHNAAPQQTLPVLVPDVSGGVKAVPMKWGWKPAWSRQLLINAQAETIQSKPAFKSFLTQRCLVPADGFYEWTTDKTPIMFTKADGAPICFAGLWQEGEASPAGPAQRFLILTTRPNAAVAKVHNRMPLIVQPQHYGWWLAGENFPAVLDAPDTGALAATPVCRELNNVKNEGAELIQPAPVQATWF
jgi:putative SOS response-associated peptidase YedK